jgi:hypothetical protein
VHHISSMISVNNSIFLIFCICKTNPEYARNRGVNLVNTLTTLWQKITFRFRITIRKSKTNQEG